MGKLGSIVGRNCSYPSGGRMRPQPRDLRHNGALADLGGPFDNIVGHRFSHSSHSEELNRLTEQLSLVDDKPKDLAERLLYRFGSVSGIFDAPADELQNFAKAGELWPQVVIAMRSLFIDALQYKIYRKRVGDDLTPSATYCHALLRGKRTEAMMIFFADEEGYVISEDCIEGGSTSQLVVSSRTILGRALNLNAHRLLLAHNHTSGSAEPSEADVYYTRQLINQAKALSIRIDDHLIVGRHEVVSMNLRGLL